MRSPLAIGRHLHNQIIIPLLLTALIVAVVATAVAVVLMSRLTDQWVESSADAASLSVRSHLTQVASERVAMARLIADRASLDQRLTTGDASGVAALLETDNTSARADALFVLDENGAIVASTGSRLQLEPGDEPLGADTLSAVSGRTGVATFVRIGDMETLSALQTLEAGGRRFTLVLCDALDDQLLERTAEGSTGSFGLFDEGGRRLGIYAETGVGDTPATMLDTPGPIVVDAIREAKGEDGGTAQANAGGDEYHVRGYRVTLPGDPAHRAVYLVSVTSSSMTDRAASTTTRLIAMWSFLAVLLLVGLGMWIARSVSTPLRALAEGARRVADGDFSTKVLASGSNELQELTESFNAMTDSLQERTESLTKKVLELATLYEMSRSLGGTLDLEDLLDSALESAMRIFGVESGYISLRDRETGSLVIEVMRGPRSSEPDATAVRSSMAEWVVREGRPLIFNPPGVTRPEGQVDSVTGALAALSAPMSTSEGVIGAVTVGTHDANVRFTGDDVRLLQTIANQVSMAIGNIELFAGLQEAYLATVRALAAAVDAKDTYTRGHSDGVAYFAGLMGEELGLSGEQCTALEIAAYLHDIGKIGVREEILLKPGRLSEVEMGQMRHHPLIGANILKPVAFPWPIAPVVRHHHEHWDGRGYPAGLKGEEVPLLARILAVADAFEAMISDRPYRSGRTRDEALAELQRCAGTQFDPRVVDAFARALGRSGAEPLGQSGEAYEVPRDEARAIFCAVCAGVLDSYRRLGGPRLSSNLEIELNGQFDQESLPFRISGGHLVADWDEKSSPDHELDVMRVALERLGTSMEGTSGRSLVDHFYEEALGNLSERMRRAAAELDLRSVH